MMVSLNENVGTTARVAEVGGQAAGGEGCGGYQKWIDRKKYFTQVDK